MVAVIGLDLRDKLLPAEARRRSRDRCVICRDSERGECKKVSGKEAPKEAQRLGQQINEGRLTSR